MKQGKPIVITLVVIIIGPSEEQFREQSDRYFFILNYEHNLIASIADFQNKKSILRTSV